MEMQKDAISISLYYHLGEYNPFVLQIFAWCNNTENECQNGIL